VQNDDNDGRRPVAWLPDLVFEGADRAVVQVIAEADGDILYTIRVRGNRFQPHVFSPGSFTVRVGRDRPNGPSLTGVRAAPTREAAGTKRIRL
jgi:hypothetical protein